MIQLTRQQALYYTLQQTHLANNPAPDVPTMVRRLIGIPATGETPRLAIQARLIISEEEPLAHPVLRYNSAMRNETHLCHQADFKMLHSATARFRRQAFNAEFRTWGISNDEVKHLAEQLKAMIADSALTQAEIIARLPAEQLKHYQQTTRGGRTATIDNVALVLRWLVAQAELYADPLPPTPPPLLRPSETPPPEPERRYRPFNQAHPDLDMGDIPSEAEAQTDLVRAYIATYGPVTEADISFWVGLDKSETTRALSRLTPETMLTMVEGIPGMLFTLKTASETLRTLTLPTEPHLTLLPADDPLTIAHRASRMRYFSDQKTQRLVFGNNSTARPTILLNGQIIGTWDDPQAPRFIQPLDPALQPLFEATLQKVQTS